MQYRTSLALSPGGQMHVKLGNFDKVTSFDPIPDNSPSSDSMSTQDGSAGFTPSSLYDRTKATGGRISTASTSLTNTIHLMTDSYTSPPQPTGPSQSMPFLTMHSIPSAVMWGSTGSLSASSSTLSNSSQTTGPPSNLNNGAKTNIILGSVLGSIFGLVAVLLAIFCGISRARRKRARAVSDQGDTKAPFNGIENRNPSNAWMHGQEIALDDFVPYAVAPAPFDRSPFDSNDLLQINHLAAPHIPQMSTRRMHRAGTQKSSGVPEATNSTAGSQFYQFRPRPEIMPARKAPKPPRMTASMSTPTVATSAQLPVEDEQKIDASHSLAAYKEKALLRASKSSSIYSILGEQTTEPDASRGRHCVMDNKPPLMSTILNMGTDLSTERCAEVDVEPLGMQSLNINSRHAAAMTERRNVPQQDMHAAPSRTSESLEVCEQKAVASNERDPNSREWTSVDEVGPSAIYDDGEGPYPDLGFSIDENGPASISALSLLTDNANARNCDQEEDPLSDKSKESDSEGADDQQEDPLDSYLEFTRAYSDASSDACKQ